MLFPDICLTLGGITTGIQILRHVIIYRISSGLPLGTSNTDTWRLKPSTRCQLLVDRSELCTKFIFNFSQLILEASARKKNGFRCCEIRLLTFKIKRSKTLQDNVRLLTFNAATQSHKLKTVHACFCDFELSARFFHGAKIRVKNISAY